MKARLTRRYADAAGTIPIPDGRGLCRPAHRSAPSRPHEDRIVRETETRTGLPPGLGIRPEAVERARELIADRNYPPEPVLRKVAASLIRRLK